MIKIIQAKGLKEKELKEIRELERACCREQQLYMKLNWDMLEKRPVNEINDLFYYEGDMLAGYLGMYSMYKGAKEVEITGMIHPEYRRNGVFRSMLHIAANECRGRGAERILLVAERSSDSATAFAKAVNAEYTTSEYRMKFSEKKVPDFPGSGIKLRKPEYSEYSELSTLDREGFGQEADVAFDYSNTFVAELEGRFVGKIGLAMEGEEGYIFGFIVKPEFRGRGYGREILSLALEVMLWGNITTTLLEVAVRNERALSLYESCGFKAVTVYDYYKLGITKQKSC